MIERRLFGTLEKALERMPAVALLGPRQVGKTTLALQLAESQDSLYLDLENEQDLARLADPAAYLREQADKLVILDEVQRAPELFKTLRGIIDENRRAGRKAGQFLLLGSASIDLIRQSSETLAGRIAYLELTGLDAFEIEADGIQQLWLRGGFPESYLSDSDEDSFAWRRDFIRTYLERDIPQFNPRVPAETLRRFWTMLAHQQGGLLNAANIARGLEVSSPTVNRYLDLLVDLLLVRRLKPWYSNDGKRLVKSPRIYVRDSGLVHALLGLRDYDDLLGHPVVGGSWEGFVIENLCAAARCSDDEASFYRATGGAELDLVLRLNGAIWGIEIKRTSAPKPSKGFRNACDDLGVDHAFIVYNGDETFPIGQGAHAIGLRAIMDALRQDT